jgi:hypothetical protein
MFAAPPEKPEDEWRRILADFAKTNDRDLAALSWGLWQDKQLEENVIGIDMIPTPHFIYCPKSAIAQLNTNVDNRLREVLGILDGFNPEKEVLIFGICDGQIKLINFETEPPPPECFTEVGADINTLLDRLEARLQGKVEA